MNLINYLKKKKTQLLNAEQSNKNDEKIYSIDNIEIVIESNKNLFENEEEIVKKGAITLLENKYVESIEEGIITFATVIRGLKYTKTEKNENGKTLILLRDIELEKTFTKKM